MLIRLLIFLVVPVVSIAQSALELESQVKESARTKNSMNVASFGLTKEESTRYETLMQGEAGLFYGHLAVSPFDILGIYANTDAERLQWAKRSAKQGYERLEREIAFNNAVNAAMEQLYPSVLPVKSFDTTPFSQHYSAALDESRAVLLVDSKVALTDASLSNLLADISAKDMTGLTIYIDEANQDIFSQWLTRYPSLASLLAKGRVTLDAAPSFLKHLVKPGVPQLFQLKHGQLTLLA